MYGGVNIDWENVKILLLTSLPLMSDNHPPPTKNCPVYGNFGRLGQRRRRVSPATRAHVISWNKTKTPLKEGFACICNFSHLISLVLSKGRMMMMAIELRLIPDMHNVNCNERIE